MRNTILSGRTLAALAVLALAVSGAALAGGAGCHHESGEAANAGDASGSHCPFAMGVTKEAKLTADGAVVTLTGKNANAVSHIQSHLQSHAKGLDCPNCPLSMKGVSTKVEMTSNGGTITAMAKSPEALKAIQDWANAPGDGCCGKGEKTKKA